MANRKKILWLDEPRYSATFAAFFDPERYEVSYSYSTTHCLRELRSGQFDLVISEYESVETNYPPDVTVRGTQTGRVLAEEIRTFNATIPVVFYHTSDWLVANRFLFHVMPPGVSQYHKRTTSPERLEVCVKMILEQAK